MFFLELCYSTIHYWRICICKDFICQRFIHFWSFLKFLWPMEVLHVRNVQWYFSRFFIFSYRFDWNYCNSTILHRMKYGWKDSVCQFFVNFWLFLRMLCPMEVQNVQTATSNECRFLQLFRFGHHILIPSAFIRSYSLSSFAIHSPSSVIQQDTTSQKFIYRLLTFLHIQWTLMCSNKSCGASPPSVILVDDWTRAWHYLLDIWSDSE